MRLGRRLGVAFAFSSLCFVNTWVELAQGKGAYFARHDPLEAVLLPVLIWQLIVMAVVFFLPSAWIVAASIIPLGFASVALLRILPFGAAAVVLHAWFWPVATLFAAGLAIWFVRRRRSRYRLPAFDEVYLYALPVLLWVMLQALWRLHPSAQYLDRPNVAQRREVKTEQARVVWVIFDEMSQEAVFEKRPAGLELPNLDRFRAEGLSGANVWPPASNTLESLPSLVVGKAVRESIPKGPRELELHFADGVVANWSETQTVFDRAPVRSAVAGWFHPYCRVLAPESTSDCAWSAGALLTGIEEPMRRQPLFPHALVDRFWFQVRAFPLAGRVPGLSPLEAANEEKQKRLDWLVDRSLRMAADPSLGLLLFHYPVPHPPGGYITNLKRSDDVLGRVMAAVEHAGLADRTVFVVSSDHGWRPGIWSRTADWSPEEASLAARIEAGRIPFLVRFPGRADRQVLEGRWNSVGTARLVLEILEGRVSTASAAVQVLIY